MDIKSGKSVIVECGHINDHPHVCGYQKGRHRCDKQRGNDKPETFVSDIIPHGYYYTPVNRYCLEW